MTFYLIVLVTIVTHMAFKGSKVLIALFAIDHAPGFKGSYPRRPSGAWRKGLEFAISVPAHAAVAAPRRGIEQGDIT